jgi:hypothetical protein
LKVEEVFCVLIKVSMSNMWETSNINNFFRYFILIIKGMD